MKEEFTLSDLQAEATKVENKVITEKEFKILQKDPTFGTIFVDKIKFYVFYEK